MKTGGYFNSALAANVFKSNELFEAAQFHFHTESEHTIHGKRFDLEMHIVHTAKTTKNKVTHSAMGMLFDVDDHNANLTDD